MTSLTDDRFLNEGLVDEPIELTAEDGIPAAVHVIDRASIQAVNAAIATGRPLLVRGEPGTGKTQLARAVARSLERIFVPFTVNSRTEVDDLLYQTDLVERLAQAQAMPPDADVDQILAPKRYVRPGPLWLALNWTRAQEHLAETGQTALVKPKGWTPKRGVVLLIDEIDKADPAVPNGLLGALGGLWFDVRGVGRIEADPAAAPPLIIITSNDERTLPAAFLRRCLILRLGLPAHSEAQLAWLIARGAAHHPDLAKQQPAILKAAAKMLVEDRAKLATRRGPKPGVAEFIDLLDAIVEQGRDAADRERLLHAVREFTFLKYEAYAHNVPEAHR